MRFTLHRIRDRVIARERVTLAIIVTLTASILAAACIWKYGIFAYNGIDLAYFNQVFWNTIHGRPFVQSIHPHLSLGDHAELAILLLAPLYALLPDPRTLLVLQAAALALPAYAVWKIAAKRLGAEVHGHRKAMILAPIVLAAAYLLNPTVHNIALFEFHMLAFAVLPLMMAMLAYENGNKARFLAWTLVALLVREDVALVVVMIGVLAWTERKSLWWRLVPMALGAGWFLAAARLIAHFSPGGGYKYRVYYAWLGDTPPAMLTNAITDPLRILGHVLTLANLEMVIGFLMPLALLPLLRPRRLLLAVGPLLQIILGAPGGGELILETHYAALFLPALMLAAIDGLGAWPAFSTRMRKLMTADESRRFAYVLLLLGATYGAVTIGPLPSAAWRALTDRNAYERASAAREVIQHVPPDEGVIASYSLLPALSSRERLVSLHYVFLGVTQFGEAPYEPPEDIRYVALDGEDLLAYRAQFLRTAWAAPHVADGYERLKKILGGWTVYETPFVLHEKGVPWRVGFIDDAVANAYLNQPASTHLYQIDARVARDEHSKAPYLVIGTRWWLRGEDPDELTVRMEVNTEDGRKIAFQQPLAALPPLSLKDEETGDYVSMARIAVPPDTKIRGFVTVMLERENAVYGLDGIRSPQRRIIDSETIDIVMTGIE